ncbi:hypothetical protein MKX01_012930 [Papaver californicum]|nr:hypothetical protein MKX01_012930 [Papaver californicum]
MAKQSTGWNPFNQKRWLLMFLFLIFLISTVIVFMIRPAFNCGWQKDYYQGANTQIHLTASTVNNQNPLARGPLLLMELAFLLRSAGAKVVWITNRIQTEQDDVIYSLEHKMLSRGVQVLPANGREAVHCRQKDCSKHCCCREVA